MLSAWRQALRKARQWNLSPTVAEVLSIHVDKRPFIGVLILWLMLATFEKRFRYSSIKPIEEDLEVKKTALVLATAAVLGLSAVAAPSPAEARWRGGGFGAGIAGGLIAGAVIGGIASSAYGYGPGYGYGYPGYGYYGGYAPAYYGGYAPAYYGGYDPYPWGGYTTTTYYSGGYAPAYYGPRYRRVVRPAFAYYGVPYAGRVVHHRWHRHHR
jgi:hypothetical protein